MKKLFIILFLIPGIAFGMKRKADKTFPLPQAKICYTDEPALQLATAQSILNAINVTPEEEKGLKDVWLSLLPELDQNIFRNSLAQETFALFFPEQLAQLERHEKITLATNFMQRSLTILRSAIKQPENTPHFLVIPPGTKERCKAALRFLECLALNRTIKEYPNNNFLLQPTTRLSAQVLAHNVYLLVRLPHGQNALIDNLPHGLTFWQ